jgi:polyhydroxyalkanoate synthesis repressor PhaR
MPFEGQWTGQIMAERAARDKAPVLIKKYANRRLYNTATSSYVTLDHLSQMVKNGTEFVVFDAKSGNDITRPVLTQIIVEEESKGHNLLPISFLRHLISFYGDSLQSLVPQYLEHSMQAFAHNQEQMRHYMPDALDGLFPFAKFEEMGKQNMAMFEKAMSVFTPGMAGVDGPNGDGANGDGANDAAGADDGAPAARQISELQAKLDMMQRQLDALTDDNKRS